MGNRCVACCGDVQQRYRAPKASALLTRISRLTKYRTRRLYIGVRNLHFLAMRTTVVETDLDCLTRAGAMGATGEQHNGDQTCAQSGR